MGWYEVILFDCLYIVQWQGNQVPLYELLSRQLVMTKFHDMKHLLPQCVQMRQLGRIQIEVSCSKTCLMFKPVQSWTRRLGTSWTLPGKPGGREMKAKYRNPTLFVYQASSTPLCWSWAQSWHSWHVNFGRRACTMHHRLCADIIQWSCKENWKRNCGYKVAKAASSTTMCLMHADEEEKPISLGKIRFERTKLVRLRPQAQSSMCAVRGWTQSLRCDAEGSWSAMNDLDKKFPVRVMNRSSLTASWRRELYQASWQLQRSWKGQGLEIELTW